MSKPYMYFNPRFTDMGQFDPKWSSKFNHHLEFHNIGMSACDIFSHNVKIIVTPNWSFIVTNNKLINI